MQIMRSIYLDLRKNKNYQLVEAKQGDHASRFVSVTLMEGEQIYIPPAGTEARFRCVKPDGCSCDNTALIREDGTILLELTAQVLAVPGEVRADVVLMSPEGKTLSSSTFTILVGKIPQGEDLDGTNELLTYSALIEEGRALYDEMRSAKENGEFKGAPGANGSDGQNGLSVFAANISAGTATEIRVLSDDVVTNGRSIQIGDNLLTADGKVFTVQSFGGSADSSGNVVFCYNAALLTDLNDGEELPVYWKSALDEGAEAINKALCEAGRNKSAFLFYSDAHWDYGAKMAPTLLKYLNNHTGMARTFFGGDIVNDEPNDANVEDFDEMAYLWEWRRQLKDLPNHHSVPGNHDNANGKGGLFTEQFVYCYLLAAEETPDMVRGPPQNKQTAQKTPCVENIEF